jgi:WD40 repeat protein
MFKTIGKNKIILKGDETWIRSAIVLSENLILLSSFDNKTLKVWNINDLKCTAAIEEETYNGSLLKLQDGNIAIGCIKSINIRNINDSLKCIRTIVFRDYSGYSDLKLLTDSSLAFTAYRPRHIHSLIVTNLSKDSSFSKIVDETEDLINPIATWSNIMTSNSYHDNAIKVWSVNGDEDINLLGKLTRHSEKLLALMFAENNLVVSGSYDYTIRVWNIDNYQCVKIIQQSDYAAILVILPNGYFAACSFKEIKIYNLNGYNCVNTLAGHEDYIPCMLFIKGNRILTSSRDIITIIWGY